MNESAECDYIRLQALPQHLHQQLQGLRSIVALCTGIDERAVYDYILHQTLPLHLHQTLQGLLSIILAPCAGTDE